MDVFEADYQQWVWRLALIVCFSHRAQICWTKKRK
jgi:hypothetical protein